MKDYQEVVNMRYNQDPFEGSIYDANQPIGKYTRYQIFKCFREIFKKQLKVDMNEATLLDVGCGTGGMLSFFKNEGFNPSHLTGIDLSEKRIEKARKDNPDIHFIIDNGLNFKLDEKYDVITSLDMFSHFKLESDVIAGLSNINSHLENKGIFIWYDICSDDHFNSPSDTDSWGFSLKQMKELGKKAGLVSISHEEVFRKFFGKYHSAYQAKRIPAALLRLMEKLIPGDPGNLAVVFKKDQTGVNK